MAIKNYTIATSTQTYYQSSGETVVTPIYLYNRSGSTISANIFLVDNSSGSGTANVASQIYGNLTITAGDTYVIDKEKLILAGNDFIAANCSTANALTMTVSYSSI